MLSTVFARVNDHQRPFQLSHMQRPNLAEVSHRGEAFAFHNNWTFIVVNMKFAFNLDIVSTPHATSETAKPRTWTDDPVRSDVRGPLVGGDIPSAGHRREEEDRESVLSDSIRRRHLGVLREEAT
jgi:hypothetical protein